MSWFPARARSAGSRKPIRLAADFDRAGDDEHLCRNDRLFPAEWVRRVVRDRLGMTPDEIDSGHTPALSRPRELAEKLEAYRAGLGSAARDSD
jgi:hypothetical protein